MNIKSIILLLFLALSFILVSCQEGESNSNSTENPGTTIEGLTPGESSVEMMGDCEVLGDFPETTSCIRVSVTCENLPPIMASLRITRPRSEPSNRGTVVLGSGGTGRSFLGKNEPTKGSPALEIVLQLADAGFTVVERKWQFGWFGEGSEGLGIIEPSCRHATLLKWLDERNENDGAMCAFGNSGGSSEIAYGLTRWNTESILDLAVIGSGPPMANLANGCLGFNYDPSWEQTCTEIWNSSQTQCAREEAPVCTLSGRSVALGPQEIDAAFAIAGLNNLCTGNSATFTSEFEENSVLFPGADLAYPNTPVHFIYGRQDCTEAAALGPLYLEAITSETSVQYLKDVGHEIQDFRPGAAAIVQEMIDYCPVLP